MKNCDFSGTSFQLKTHRPEAAISQRSPETPSSIDHLHRDACAPKVEGKRRPGFPADFVLHSLRHTMLTRLGESGADGLTIVRIAGHSSNVVSERCIHPTPEAVERAFERLQLSGESTDK
jgi:integrase